jgi:membrane protease YdiL (CAAX protease family)
MHRNPSQKNHSLNYYFLLVFVLSVPLWLVGGTKLPLPVNLPVSSLTAFVPMIAALILSSRQSGSRGFKELFQTAWDYHKIKDKVWYLPILLLPPLLYIISFILMWQTERPLPDPIKIPFLWLPIYLVMYLITGIGEELGLSGYATQPVQRRWGALRASFMLGILWAVWHSIPFVQTQSPVGWVVWQSIKTVAMRMIIVWIYNKTGKSVFAAILYHTADNVSWSLFPNDGSHYDPMVTGLINCVVLIIIIFAGRYNSTMRFPGKE